MSKKSTEVKKGYEINFHWFQNNQISSILIISCLLVSSEDLLCYHYIYYHFQLQTYWTVILQYFQEQVNTEIDFKNILVVVIKAKKLSILYQ